MVTLADGRVLMVGGWPFLDGEAPLLDALPLGSAEIHDPTLGHWHPAGDLQVARSDFSLVALPDGGAIVAGGRVYSDAGDFGYSVAPTASTERFTPTPYSGFWVASADMHTAAADRAATPIASGKVLVAGGDLTADEADLDLTPPALTADAELYDPAADVWLPTTPMPRPRSGASAVLLEDGSVLVAGGILAYAPTGDTPSCPEPDRQALRFVPGKADRALPTPQGDVREGVFPLGSGGGITFGHVFDPTTLEIVDPSDAFSLDDPAIAWSASLSEEVHISEIDIQSA